MDANSIKLRREIELHQIKLEAQNEALKHLKEKAEVEAEKYLELYESSLAGNFTLSEEGEILELNLAAATLLGKGRIHLKHNNFAQFVSLATVPIFHLFLDKIFNDEGSISCEISIYPNGLQPIDVHLTGAISKDREQCLVVAIDMNEQRLAIKAINESSASTGLTINVNLPYIGNLTDTFPAKQLVSDLESENIPNVSGLKILIAEDNPISGMRLAKSLKKIAKEIFSVNTGVEAVAACQLNPDLDLILMDIQMPEMGGYEATQQIRQFNREVIIIAQTAFGLKNERERALEAGCNEYLTKPVNLNELLSLIKKLQDSFDQV